MHVCAYPRCPETTSGTYCAAHQQQKREVETRYQAGNYGRPWRRRRQAFLEAHPEHYWCAACRVEGHKVLSTDIDHIIPHRGDLELRDDERNLQGLCKMHHSAKTVRESLQAVGGGEWQHQP